MFVDFMRLPDRFHDGSSMCIEAAVIDKVKLKNSEYARSGGKHKSLWKFDMLKENEFET